MEAELMSYTYVDRDGEEHEVEIRINEYLHIPPYRGVPETPTDAFGLRESVWEVLTNGELDPVLDREIGNNPEECAAIERAIDEHMRDIEDARRYDDAMRVRALAEDYL